MEPRSAALAVTAAEQHPRSFLISLKLRRTSSIAGIPDAGTSAEEKAVYKSSSVRTAVDKFNESW